MMDWRDEAERGPASDWLRSGEHPTEDDELLTDPDETPTLSLPRSLFGGDGLVKRCRNPHCGALIWIAAPDLCSECRALWFRVAELRNKVQTGQLTDFPMSANHVTALKTWRPIQRWEKTFRTVVTNACYHLRYWPWREPHFRGFDGAPGAA